MEVINTASTLGTSYKSSAPKWVLDEAQRLGLTVAEYFASAEYKQQVSRNYAAANRVDQADINANR